VQKWLKLGQSRLRSVWSRMTNLANGAIFHLRGRVSMGRRSDQTGVGEVPRSHNNHIAFEIVGQAATLTCFGLMLTASTGTASCGQQPAP